MSEKASNLPTPETQQETLLPPQLVDPERGAVDLQALKDRTGEIVGDAVEMGKIAYHGIRASISEIRMQRSGSTMERMDHKDALYHDIGVVATRGNEPAAETASGMPARARTWAERHVDIQLDQEASQAGVKRAKQKRVDGQYDRKGPKPIPVVLRQEVRDVDEDFRQGLISPEEWQAHKVNIQEDIDHARANAPDNPASRYAHVEGIDTKIDTRRRKTRVNQRYRNGDISAAQRSAQHDQIKATPRAFENREQRKVRRKATRATRKVERMANQPVLSRWRNIRREQAIGTIKVSHRNTEKHREAQEDARIELAARRASR